MGHLQLGDFEQRVTVERIVLTRHASDDLKLGLFLELSETAQPYWHRNRAEDTGAVLFEVRGTVDIGDLRVSTKSWPSERKVVLVDDYDERTDTGGLVLRPRVSPRTPPR